MARVFNHDFTSSTQAGVMADAATWYGSLNSGQVASIASELDMDGGPQGEYGYFTGPLYLIATGLWMMRYALPVIGPPTYEQWLAENP